MAEPAEKSLDDFFAKRDKKKKKEKVKGKEPATTGSTTSIMVKKIKKEKEKSTKNENQDAQIEKVIDAKFGNFFFLLLWRLQPHSGDVFDFVSRFESVPVNIFFC